MQKKAFGNIGPMGATDYLMSAAPYGIMWYSNMLAAPWPEDYQQMSEKEKRRVRMRQLLKGAVFGGAGYAATRLLFGKDYKKMNAPEVLQARQSGSVTDDEEEKMAHALRLVASIKR